MKKFFKKRTIISACNLKCRNAFMQEFAYKNHLFSCMEERTGNNFILK